MFEFAERTLFDLEPIRETTSIDGVDIDGDDQNEGYSVSETDIDEENMPLTTPDDVY